MRGSSCYKRHELVAHLAETVAAVDGPTLGWPERHLGLGFALGADCIMHLTGAGGAAASAEAASTSPTTVIVGHPVPIRGRRI